MSSAKLCACPPTPCLRSQPSAPSPPPAGDGQPDAATVALEQRHADLILQNAYTTAEGGLLDPDMLGRAPKAVSFRDRNEVVEILQVHASLGKNRAKQAEEVGSGMGRSLILRTARPTAENSLFSSLAAELKLPPSAAANTVSECFGSVLRRRPDRRP